MSLNVDRAGASLPDFERSINGVSYADGRQGVAASLPRRAQLVPVDEGGVGSRTAVLLNPLSSHDKLLRRYLRPPLADGAVMAPVRYRRLLAGAARQLRERRGGRSPAVERALDVLDEVQSGMDYLDVQMKRLLEA